MPPASRASGERCFFCCCAKNQPLPKPRDPRQCASPQFFLAASIPLFFRSISRRCSASTSALAACSSRKMAARRSWRASCLDAPDDRELP